MHAPKPGTRDVTNGHVEKMRPASVRPERPVMSVDDAIASWQDEWVLMQVLAFDAAGWPQRGELVAHSPNRAAISEVLAGEPPRAEQPERGPYYIFRANPRARSGPEFDAAVAKLVGEIHTVQAERDARPRR
jgi:hypothetical protein